MTAIEMTVEQASAILNEYRQIESDVMAVGQPLIAAAYAAMSDSPVRGPESPAATQYRALVLGFGALVRERAAHLRHRWNGHEFRDLVNDAESATWSAQRAEAFAATADAVDLAERIAYGEEAR